MINGLTSFISLFLLCLFNLFASAKVGQDTFATEFDLEAEEYVPLPKGDVHKKKEIVQDVTLHDLDVANAINLLVVYRESVNLIGYITRRLSADSLQLWIANENRLFWTRDACFTPQCTSRAVFETFELPM